MGLCTYFIAAGISADGLFQLDAVRIAVVSTKFVLLKNEK